MYYKGQDKDAGYFLAQGRGRKRAQEAKEFISDYLYDEKNIELNSYKLPNIIMESSYSSSF